ncbi:MAG: ferritin-like fold-containing protein [Actinomycetota bacterium]
MDEFDPAGHEPSREEAIATVIGGVAHALIRVFAISAQAVLWAPTLSLRERQAAFAVEEYERFRVVRRRLGVISSDPEAAIERFRPALDAFYDAAPIDGWLEAQVFHYVGDTVSADFAEILTGYLDARTAASVREALTGRGAHEAFALDQIDQARVAGDPEVEKVIVATASRVVGEAINGVRDAVLASNSLEVVLGGPEGVKELVLELLGRHRERLERLGLDRLD